MSYELGICVVPQGSGRKIANLVACINGGSLRLVRCEAFQTGDASQPQNFPLLPTHGRLAEATVSPTHSTQPQFSLLVGSFCEDTDYLAWHEKDGGA